MRTAYDKDLTTVKKGDIITETQTRYDGSTTTLKWRVERINPKTVTVKCISGYLEGSSCKLIKPQAPKIVTKFARVVRTYNDLTLETVYYTEDNRVYAKDYTNGEYKGKSMVYDIKSDKPYIKAYGKRWYLTGDDLDALRSLFE